jgi:hypothetical protein
MSHVLSDKEVADKAEAAGGACWPRINRTTSKAYAASANGKERDRRYRATEKGKAAGKRFCQRATETNEAGDKRARVLQESIWEKHSSRLAVQQKTNEPQMGRLGRLLGGSRAS